MENLENKTNEEKHLESQEKVAEKITEAMKPANGKTDEKKPVEKKKTDKKKFSKAEVKAVKDKVKGITRAINDHLICFVCGKPILKGQSLKELPKDEKHPHKRPYHSATCGIGSKAWAKMSGSKFANSLAEKKNGKPKKERVAKPKKEKKPLPEPTGKKLHINPDIKLKKYERYPFGKMVKGDFFIEELKGQDSVRRLSNRFAHKQKPLWKFSIRKIDEGFRCVRIA